VLSLFPSREMGTPVTTTEQRAKPVGPLLVGGIFVLAAGVGLYAWLSSPAKSVPPAKVQVAAPARPPAPPLTPGFPAPSRNGYVNIEVDPQGDVFLGPKLLGHTPMDPIELEEGGYVLTVKNDALKAEKKVKVVVLPGRTVQSHVRLTP
jgi:hypothetical protein